MKSIETLKIELYADGADKEGIVELYEKPYIKGLTTNPTLMRKAGISNYEEFAKDILKIVIDKPISFEVFTDDLIDMERQALKLASFGENVYVKIPITNSKGISCVSLIDNLAKRGVKLNVTAVMTIKQVKAVAAVLNPETPSIISIFAGRIADCGTDPVPMMTEAAQILGGNKSAKLLWASVREVINIYHAEGAGAKIVTVPHDILAKAIKMIGSDLEKISIETVKMFATDAIAAGYKL